MYHRSLTYKRPKHCLWHLRKSCSSITSCITNDKQYNAITLKGTFNIYSLSNVSCQHITTGYNSYMCHNILLHQITGLLNQTAMDHVTSKHIMFKYNTLCQKRVFSWDKVSHTKCTLCHTIAIHVTLHIILHCWVSFISNKLPRFNL